MLVLFLEEGVRAGAAMVLSGDSEGWPRGQTICECVEVFRSYILFALLNFHPINIYLGLFA